MERFDGIFLNDGSFHPINNIPHFQFQHIYWHVQNMDRSNFTTRSSTLQPDPTTQTSPTSPSEDCTPPSIDDFPSDLFTQSERRHGWIAVHFVVSVYVFYALALVCDEYFVPSIECICTGMHLPSDVAGASFMAIATSSPELFTNVIGTFITKGDIGVGTIVGSAVFNILAIAGICGMAAQTALPLEWYPLTRDCFFYSISVILLIVALTNRKVFWYEALVLVVVYVIYIFVMYKNTALKKKAEELVDKVSKGCCGKTSDPYDTEVLIKKKKSRGSSRRTSFVAELTASTERTPLIGGDEEGARSRHLSFSQSYERLAKAGRGDDISAEALDELLIAKALQEQEEEEKDEWAVFSIPKGASLWIIFLWAVTWPARFFLRITVPDCREGNWRSWYMATFLMCIVWIASLSYLISWMMTIIGHTLGIPDSVMGLTFLAAGTSIPEAVSSVIVARQGLGTMSISNSIGSNTFDILVCLGLPWLIKGSLIASDPVQNYIQINSGGLEYSAMILMVSLILLYGTLAVNKFYLDKKVGFAALAMYAAFLVFASLLEMNVFVTVNLPTCEIFEE
ncbi:Sodium/potassium/calcium exchanger 3 [Folsomia candida]|uniref:Sodium/potassium/calcium exchanger 3 n=1 Tax=Folsomia candida TaxID=158441 RepID=A0A226EM38_FOLCA|nr:Sodium/potassium/calcium exchanger 3 [Folsomia candida]